MRPLIVGMNNPVTARGAAALEPWTPNGSGEKLWKMVNQVTGWTKREYVERFQLINVVRSVNWDAVEAKAGAKRVRSLARRRPTVILGRQTWLALGLRRDARWFETHDNFHLVPHPSGRCILYNDHDTRLRTGRLLAQLGNGVHNL